MTPVAYLTLEDLLGMVRRLGLGPVRDIGLLDAAVARPRSTVFGDDAYPTVALKAAALLHSIVTNHALADGNKRLGWLAAVVFMDLNGESVDFADAEAFDLVWGAAEGRLDLEEIAARLGPAAR